jgi:hypothetical protein
MHRHHSLPRSLLLCLAAAAGAASPLTADSSQTSERTITKLADGVYEIHHADPLPGWVSGNTLVVIGTRSVFVVDSCFVAWEAKADIAQIRKWTSLPVRYLLNTHWHQDHNAGNGAYLEAFPGADIVATNETKRRLEANSSSNATLIRASVEQTGKQLANELESGKEADGQPLSEERKTRARRTLAQVDKVTAVLPPGAYSLRGFIRALIKPIPARSSAIEIKPHLESIGTAGPKPVTATDSPASPHAARASRLLPSPA